MKIIHFYKFILVYITTHHSIIEMALRRALLTGLASVEGITQGIVGGVKIDKKAVSFSRGMD